MGLPSCFETCLLTQKIKIHSGKCLGTGKPTTCSSVVRVTGKSKSYFDGLERSGDPARRKRKFTHQKKLGLQPVHVKYLLAAQYGGKPNWKGPTQSKTEIVLGRIFQTRRIG